jgi:tetratricopeptide (TPR) repeat protein
LIKQGKRTEAKQVLESQIEQPKPGEQAVLTYADAVVGMDYEHSGEPKTLSANEYKKVKNIIDTCLEQDSDNTRAQLLQAELFENKSMHEQAFEVYSKLLEKQNSIDKSFMERIQAGFASSASFMGKFEMALAAIKQAVEARPEWVGLRKVLANVYAMAGEITDALAQAETVLNIGPQIMDSILWFVDFLGGLGKNNEAETKLREVVAEHPDNLQLQTRLAELLIKNGKQSEAKEIVLAVLPGISAALPDEELVKAAEVFAQTGDTASALVCLEYRINKSGSLSSQLDLAGYLYRQEQYTKALDELERIDAHNDSVCLVGCLKADTLVKTGELEKALELLQSISTEVNFNALDEPLHFAPQQWNELIGLKNPRLELQTGIAFKLGKLQTSQALAKKWLELEPENAEAWVALLESEQGSGEVSNELLHLSVPNDSITDGFTASLVALKIDTLLESDQAIEAQQLFEKFNSTGNYSVKSTGIRLSVLAGHLAEAETMLDELMSSRKQIEDEEELLKIGTVRNLVKSAVTLQRWNEALSLSSEMATNYSWNSACALQYLIVLVRAKEFENTAKSLSIETHNPSNFLQQIKMEEEINWLAGLLDGKNEEEVKRWILRGKMVAEPVTENIKAFALVTPKSDDVAAMVAALHNNMQDSTALQVAKKFPTNANVLFELARIQAETEPAAAVETLNTLINNEPLMPAALALRSILLEKTGKLDLAINDFEQAISDWPNEIKWRLTVAEMWQRYGNNPNAIHQLQSAHTIKPEDVMVALALGKASIDAGDFDQAVEVLQPVTTQHPNEYEAWETLSEAHSGRDDMEQALAAAKKASEINPFSTKPYLMSGKIHLEHGNLDKALEQAKQAVSQNKKDADAILFLAKVLHQQGEERQALAALEMTNQCEDATVQNMIEHVNLVKEINGGAYAKELISSLSNKYPENVELLKMLASTQAENGDTNDAEETAKRALQVDPDEPDLHLFLGKINAETGQLDQAIHHLSQGIHKKTDQMDGYLMLSKVYEQQREFTKALDALKQAMEVSPTDTRSYVAAANLYRNSKDYSNAEMVLQKAVEIDPRDVAIRRQLGALLALKLVHHSQEAGSQS